MGVTQGADKGVRSLVFGPARLIEEPVSHWAIIPAR